METLKLAFSTICWIGFFFQLGIFLLYVWGISAIGKEEFTKLYEDAISKNLRDREVTWKTNLGRRILFALLTIACLYFLDFFSYANLKYNIFWSISVILSFTVFPYNNEKHILKMKDIVILSTSLFYLRFFSYVGTGLVWFFGF